MGKLVDAGREILGTCREAKENFDFDQLVKKHDNHTAEMLISDQLRKGGISLGDFHAYKKVKTFVQNGGLDVAKAHKEAQKDAYDALVSDSFGPNVVA